MKVDKILSYILIISIVIAVASVIYIIIDPSPGEKFTQFYILDSNGKAGNYPTNLSVGENGNLTINIINNEGSPANYQLVVNIGNDTLENQSFKLANKEKEEIPFTFQPKQSGNQQKLEFLLYKLPNSQQPYRYLDLIINVTQ
jgi:uncharacterized membrane protein